MQYTLTRSLALLLTLAVVAAACGDGDDDGPAPQATAAVESTDDEAVSQPTPDAESTDDPDDSSAAEADTQGAEDEPESDEAEQADVEEPVEPVEVTYWHAMKDKNGEALDMLTAEFNSLRDDIKVNAVFQGSYDDVYQQTLASFEIGDLPTIVQSFDMGTQTMIDTGRIVPVQSLMDAEGYDADVFITAVRSYYSDDYGMVGMPFNTSTPVLVYNVDLFDAAGVEPAVPGDAWSFSEFNEACDRLESSVVDHCIALRQLHWFFEQLLANSGGLYLNENNGRTGRATEVLYTDDRGVEVFSWMTGLVRDGHSENFGNNNDDVKAAFLAEQAAMMFNSSGGLGAYADASFEWGVMYLPYADSAGGHQGVVLGGGANYIMDTGNDTESQAAWEFLKFLAEADSQLFWHQSTGFVPVRADILDDQRLLDLWAETPAIEVAARQLAESSLPLADGSPNYGALGGRAGPLPAVRNLISDAFNAAVNEGVSPAEALQEQAEKAAVLLADYNSFFVS